MLVTLFGCSPALDWREIRPDGAGVLALFPCRPSRQERPQALAGQTVRLQMLSCETQGMMWALSWADVGDPARVGPVLEALPRALAANLAAPLGSLTAYSPPGATPNAASGRTVLSGRAPDGRAVAAHTAVFARAMNVYQLTALGADGAPAFVEVFLDGVKAVP